VGGPSGHQFSFRNQLVQAAQGMEEGLAVEGGPRESSGRLKHCNNSQREDRADG
jgi:hypothetical protein